MTEKNDQKKSEQQPQQGGGQQQGGSQQGGGQQQQGKQSKVGDDSSTQDKQGGGQQQKKGGGGQQAGKQQGGGSQKKQQQQKEEQIGLPEWVTFAIGLTIVLGIAILYTVLHFSNSNTAPVIEVRPQLDRVYTRAGRYYLPVYVENTGGHTAEDVTINLSLSGADGQPETESVTANVRFMPPRETSTVLITFDYDPRTGSVQYRVSFKEPLQN